MPRAFVTLRPIPPIRRDGYVEGLKRCGYTVGFIPDQKPDPDDVLVIWNRSSIHETWAKIYEAKGATVICTENGFIGTDENGWRRYSLFLNHHNGIGKWFVGEEDRWAKLGIEVQPWRTAGKDILLLPQRGIGERGIAMPMHWVRNTIGTIKERSKRNVRVRMHPGRDEIPLAPDFKNVWATATWGSGAAIKGIVMGVPCFYDLENWIGAPAAVRGFQNLENPFLDDRMPMLHRMAWSQWTISEIASGEPFRYLLKLAGRKVPHAVKRGDL